MGISRKIRSGYLLKVLLILLGLLFLAGIRWGRKEAEQTQETAEGISREDVGILLDALQIGQTAFSEETEGQLTYGEYLAIRDAAGCQELPDYRGRYEETQPLSKEDWYRAFWILAAMQDAGETIWETSAFVLTLNSQEHTVCTAQDAAEGGRHYRSSAFEDALFRNVRVLVWEDELLTILSVEDEPYLLQNVLVRESGEGRLQCFWHQTDFDAAWSQEQGSGGSFQEQIADLCFQDGSLQKVSFREQRVHGKLLRLTDTEIEIEGAGTFRLGEKLEIYRLYDSLTCLQPGDLRIGCEDSDYVIADGEVCAVLISRRENTDMIRVLLRNPSDGSAYCDTVTLQVDGEEITFRAEDLELGERKSCQSANLTGCIGITADGVAKADTPYRGRVECCRMEEGIVVVNELPLEEYLYAVVPSEMPASYPQEALRAQAVCARTYGCRYVLHAGLPEFGAHVDDTTAYQVYHSCAEKAASTTAVKETDGMILTYRGEPAENYYYATSCGVGTDASVWNDAAKESLPYLQAAVYEQPEDGKEQETGADNAAQDTLSAAACEEEEAFRSLITTVNDRAWERDEAWYRWTYRTENVDSAQLLERIRRRYQAAPGKILTRQEDGSYVSEPVTSLGDVLALTITERGAGGVAKELLIEAEDATLKVLSEYNIRSILCDGSTEVIRQDGSRASTGSLLPSGFFIIETVRETGKSDGSVVRYTLTGGGCGHGVGMSQNGAKAMGAYGRSYQEILAAYFPGCTLETLPYAAEEIPEA